MIKVLVCGSSGQLGSCLHYLSESYNNIKMFYYDREGMDITNIGPVYDVLNFIKPNYVINCASYNDVNQAEIDKNNAFATNALGVKNLALVCNTLDITLLHVSTDYVFDGVADIPYVEDSIPNPLNYYGHTKLQGEYEIQKHHSKYFILRTSWLYSAFGNNFFTRLINDIVNEPFSYMVNDQLQSPTYAVDLANVILKLISYHQLNLQQNIFGIYHFSNSGFTTRYDFALKVIDFIGSNCKIIPVEMSHLSSNVLRPKYCSLSSDKLNKILGLKPLTWENSLNDCLNYFNTALNIT